MRSSMHTLHEGVELAAGDATGDVTGDVSGVTLEKDTAGRLLSASEAAMARAICRSSSSSEDAVSLAIGNATAY